MVSDIIKINHLNKSFGEVKAVNDLSFRVKEGELFAFLGVNGAGKSTTISILCGLLKKDSGSVLVNGIETDKAGAQTKRMLGVVFQDSVLDKPLTVKENLMSRAALYGITGNAFDKRLQELVVILDKGSIAAQGTPFELKNNYVQDIVSVYGVSEDEIKTLNREYKKIRDGYQIKVRNTKEATKLIIDHQELFTDYEVVKGGMDDVFLAVTGKKLGGER